MIIVGIDEVGRGCWAGPLVAGAVVLGQPIPGLRDSKKLTKPQRERLAIQIYDEAIAVGLGWVWPEFIDSHGLTESVRQAMALAMKHIECTYDEVIIDGHINYLPNLHKTRALIKADDLIPAVSAASVVAKVARDAYMTEQALLYPQYGFEAHVGYGTAQHSTMLGEYGVTDIHRKSYKPIQQFMMLAK